MAQWIKSSTCIRPLDGSIREEMLHKVFQSVFLFRLFLRSHPPFVEQSLAALYMGVALYFVQ
jgi:hypothetical protein